MIFATVGYYLIASLVQYIPIYFVDRMYRNFFNLEKAEKLDETGFVKPAVAGEVFDLYTDQKRITNAVFVSLKTKEDTTALKKLFEDYNSDTLFFKPTPDVYGFLVPLKNKDIQNFESVVRTIELGLRATLMEYKAGATYYGPNTERFDELAEQSLYALNDSNNDLLIYDYRSIKEVLSARENVAKTSFYSTQTKISYLNSITASKNTIIPVYDNEGFENFEEEILTLDKETRAMILSQLALRILKEDNQFDTVIPYSIKSIENVDEFTKKVKEYKDPSNVVIAVYYEDLKVKKEMMDKVKELRSNGFRISINNFNKVNERLLKTYKPEFVQSIKKRTLTDFTTPVEQMMEEVRKVSPNTIELG